MTLRNGFGKCSLFVCQPVDEEIKTWTLRFPTKENPNIERALFDQPIVLKVKNNLKKLQRGNETGANESTLRMWLNQSN